MEEKKVIFCDCGGQMIALEFDTELQCFFVSMYELYGRNEDDWKQRLRHCWKILTTGLPWTDSIVMSPEKAQELSAFINAKIKKDS